MNWWRRLMRRSGLEEQLDKELRFHVDAHAADLAARGVEPGEAARQARLALGGVDQVKERCRDERGTRWLDELRQDLRFGLRTLGRSPGFTCVVVATLGLGVGATTAIFSAVNPILFESLPYPNADRLVALTDFTADGAPLDVTFGTYREIAERSRSFDALAVAKPWQPTLTGAGTPERFEGQRVSADYFRALGVAPAIGRDLQASDDGADGPKVVVLGDALWRRRFGADAAIVGRQISLGDTSYTVLGVMPHGFENVLAPSAEIWAPLQYDVALPADGREWGHHLRMIGRLRPGVDEDQARRELAAIAGAPVAEFARPPWALLGLGVAVSGLQESVTGEVRPALLAVLGAVVLVLLIACVNVTNLLLARSAQRRGELAVRAALGAGRGRLARQMLTESLLLALLGGALGVGVARAGVVALVALSPAGLPRADAIRVDGSVLAFALAVTTLVGLAIGAVPALYASRGGLRQEIERGTRRSTGAHQWTRRALVVTEVALALTLLVSAGLLLRSLQSLFAVAPGFEPSNVLTMQVQVAGHRFDDDGAAHRFFEGALEAVRRVPGVAEAGFTSQLPLSGDRDVYGVDFESSPSPDGENGSAFRYAVTPGYVETMRIPLVRGRSLGPSDEAEGPSAALISESYARRAFGGEDPIGRRLHLGPKQGAWATIVGVVGDVAQTSLADGPGDAVYLPATKWPFADRARWLVVRARGDAAALVPDVKAAIWSVDKDQPVLHVATMESRLAASADQRRFALVLFEAFGAVALALAAIGIYGVLSGGVTERRREIGVRIALGATRADILGLVVWNGMALAGLGVAIGVVGAVAASRALDTMLFGVSQLDPVTYLGVTALLTVVSAVACWLPAWRATRVDPTIALRAE